MTKSQEQRVIDNLDLVKMIIYKSGIPYGLREEYEGDLNLSLCEIALKAPHKNNDEFRAYAYKSLMNSVKDIRKKAFAEKRIGQEILMDRIGVFQALDAKSMEEFEKHKKNLQNMFTISKKIRCISIEEQKIIKMLLDGYEVNDIANAHHVSRQAMYQHIHRIYKKIRSANNGEETKRSKKRSSKR